MLERATACLKSGAAARDSLKCVRNAPRSSRLLHSTFWNHGAGALDLSCLDLPALPHSNGKHSRGQGKSLNSVETELLQQSHAAPDAPFLDFLYPPQALAWFQRANAAQCQRWERRNARRLPDGFVVASREYSSRSQKRSGPVQTPQAGEQQREEAVVTNGATQHDGGIARLEATLRRAEEWPPENDPECETWTLHEDFGGEKSGPSLSNTQNVASFSPFDSFEDMPEVDDRSTDISTSILRADSPGERAEFAGPSSLQSRSEPGPESETESSLGLELELEPQEGQSLAQNLYNILKIGKTARPSKGEFLVKRAALTYYSLDDTSRKDPKLNQAMLEFLASSSTENKKKVRVLARKVLDSILLPDRTLQTYQAMFSIFKPSNRLKLPPKLTRYLHEEALRNLENGHQISHKLVREALEKNSWMVAMEIALQLHDHYAHDYHTSQVRVFWLHISETPNLLQKAILLAEWLGSPRSTRFRQWPEKTEGSDLDLEQKLSRICAALYEEAIAQEFLRMEGQTSFGDLPLLDKWPTAKIRDLIDQVPALKDNGAKLLGDILTNILRYKTGASYTQLHLLASSIYDRYRETPGAAPSEELFMLWLRRLMEVVDGPAKPRSVGGGMSILRLVTEWERYHVHVSKQGIQELMTYYARLGNVTEYDGWLTYFRSTFPDYEDQKDDLWTMVYLHSRRADLDGAQQAFAEVRRIRGEHGEEPDLKSWNMLLSAHSRADDLEGALTNVQNLMDSASLVPDEYSIHPVLKLLADRGDVEGVADILRQYGQLVDTPLTTALLQPVLTAHVNNEDIPTAESKLRQSIPLVMKGVIRGSLTGCFNVILLGHAMRRDLAGTLRTYRWMKDAKVRLDANSYAAIMQGLIMRRRTQEAANLMLFIMQRQRKIVPTSFHYAILITGFVYNRQHVRAMKTYEAMLRRGYTPTVSTNIAYLKAKAIKERGKDGKQLTETSTEDAVPLKETIAVLNQFLEKDSGMATHPTQSMHGIGDPVSDPMNAVPAAYHNFVIELLGQRRCFAAVKELHRRYMEEGEKRGGSQEAVPVSMLAALARAHYHAGEHDLVEACWKLAKAEADRVAPLLPIPRLRPPKSNSDVALDTQVEHTATCKESVQSVVEVLSDRHKDEVAAVADIPALLQSDSTPEANTAGPRTSRLAPARRHILTRILRFYLLSKKKRNQPIDAINTVTQLTEQGYVLDHITWNMFIRMLAQHAPPLTLIAFVLAERYLTPNFPGWKNLGMAGSVWPSKRYIREASLQHIKARYLAPGQLLPRYDTLVALAGALLQTRRSEVSGYGDVENGLSPALKEYMGNMEKLERLAPQTLAIVKTMPRVRDSLQERALGESDVS